MELLIGAAQKAAFAEKGAFVLGGEGDVDARRLIEAAQLDQA